MGGSPILHRLARSVLATASIIAPAVAQTPSLTLIEPVAGRQGSYGRAISADGTTAAGNMVGELSGYRGFISSASGGVNEFGSNPGVPLQTTVNGVSGNGAVVVGDRLFNAQRSFEAYRYSGGVYQALGPAPAGFTDSVARGVSGDGAIVVGGFSNSTTGSSVAMRWTAVTGMVNIGKPRPNDFGAGFNNISRDGTTAVGASKQGFDDADAYTWTQAGGWRQLPVPVGTPTIHESQARGVNFDGSLVVGSVRDFAVGTGAVLWRNGTVETLGSLGTTWSMEAWGVSDNASVIVGNGLDMQSGRYSASIWLDGNSPILLENYLRSLGVAIQADVHLQVCNGVSADGRYIVGDAQTANGNRAFVVEIPSPSTVVMGVGAILTLTYRRRSVT